MAGQWAVVTGGSQGIGAGVAAALVRAGANVVLVARDRATLDVARENLRPSAGADQHIDIVTADIGDPAAIDDLFARLGRELPHLNAFVANAGTAVVKPFLELSVDDLQRTFAVNVTGTFLCCQRAAVLMLAKPATNQAIVAVSSIRATRPRPGRAAYAASKAALNQLVRGAAAELAPHGIRCNVLSPGITSTPWAVERNREAFDDYARSVPLGAAASISDLGEAALFLCSPAAAHITGIDLVVDGGETLL